MAMVFVQTVERTSHSKASYENKCIQKIWKFESKASVVEFYFSKATVSNPANLLKTESMINIFLETF